MSKTVLLLGITGQLGGLMANALLQAKSGKAHLRAIVRPEKAASPEVKAFEARGVKILAGDLKDSGFLKSACTGVDVVVSALSGGPDVIVDAQLQVLNAAKEAGVKRFVPSDYSYDFHQTPMGTNFNSDARKIFHEHLVKSGLEWTSVINGVFMDKPVLFGFFGIWDAKNHKVNWWGDAEYKFPTTTYADTAAFTAESIFDPHATGKLTIQGDSFTPSELARTIQEVKGYPVTTERLGSVADLKARIAGAIKTDPNNYYAFIPLQYHLGMALTHPEAPQNAKYPQVKPTTLKEYLKHTEI